MLAAAHVITHAHPSPMYWGLDLVLLKPGKYSAVKLCLQPCVVFCDVSLPFLLLTFCHNFKASLLRQLH